MHASMISKAEDTLKVAPVTPIWNKNPFMWIEKKVRILIAELEQSDGEDEDEEDIPITRPVLYENH